MSYKCTVAGILLACAFSAHAGDTFPIRKFQVDGNSLLAPGELDSLLAPYVGEQGDFGRIQQALEALETAYRQRGYAAVQVRAPEQELTAGTVRFEVVEPLLGQVRLPETQTHFNADNLRRALPGLREGAVPNTREISQQVELSNENPARQMEVILGLGQQEGFVDARVKVEESNPVRFFGSLDNTGTRQTGRTRLSVGVQHANLFNQDHVLTAALAISPEKVRQVAVGSVSYRVPFYEQNALVDVFYANSDVDAGTFNAGSGTPIAFSGKGNIFGARYTHILPRVGEWSSRVSLGWDYRSYDNNCSIAGIGNSCAKAGEDIVLKPLTIAYSTQRVAPGDVVDFGVSLSANLPGGHKGNRKAFEKAGGGDVPSGYFVLRGNFSKLHALAGDWQVRGALTAQFSDQPLLTYEQLGVVGSQAVRGFLEREVARDKGAFLNLELFTPDLSRNPDGHNLRALAFVDAGYGRNNGVNDEPQDDKRPDKTVSSFGVGLRFTFGKNLSARFDVARVIKGAEARDSGDMRGHFSLMASF